MLTADMIIEAAKTITTSGETECTLRDIAWLLNVDEDMIMTEILDNLILEQKLKQLHVKFTI